MRAPRFFLSGAVALGDDVGLTGADAHKIAAVLRLRTGDRIELCDSTARVFSARLDVREREVRARLDALIADAPPPDAVRIVVAQGVPKGAKMDYVVEKLVELGVAEIVPLVSERVVADASAAKLERWNRIARAAAQQCGRSEIPAIGAPASFAHLLERSAEFDRTIVPWELAERMPLRERLPDLVAGARSLLLVVGPEGGFSHDEIEAARSAGAVPVSLGARILRTETAALVLLSIVNYALGA